MREQKDYTWEEFKELNEYEKSNFIKYLKTEKDYNTIEEISIFYFKKGRDTLKEHLKSNKLVYDHKMQIHRLIYHDTITEILQRLDKLETEGIKQNKETAKEETFKIIPLNTKEPTKLKTFKMQESIIERASKILSLEQFNKTTFQDLINTGLNMLLDDIEKEL